MLICLKSRAEELKRQGGDEAFQGETLIAIPDDIDTTNEEGATKTVVKLFLNEFHEDTIEESLKYVLKTCLTPPNLILAYAPTSKIQVRTLHFNFSASNEQFCKNSEWQIYMGRGQ